MNPELQCRFEEIEITRQKIINLVSGLSQEQFTQKPKTGGWSAAQILTHLLVSEQLSLAYMKKKSLGVETLTDSGAFENIKVWFLKISQRLPLRYKAPRVLVENTPPALPLPELNNRWNGFRQELKIFLQELMSNTFYEKYTNIPLPGD